ncbi:hypothetical protein CEXT_456951 [Caerostris extrusa]|uniref:Uncharacterized protein n=1 Tax=Caerostris extrusa TaxID=172846 RepID=A0AAV4MI43_CAEEX|nr:hypothetical protein CEXT_456951 [Caerostris extrusa]
MDRRMYTSFNGSPLHRVPLQMGPLTTGTHSYLAQIRSSGFESPGRMRRPSYITTECPGIGKPFVKGGGRRRNLEHTKEKYVTKAVAISYCHLHWCSKRIFIHRVFGFLKAILRGYRDVGGVRSE